MKSNIAVVGCGYWGKNFVRNFYELDSLYCICEPNQEIAQEFTESLKVRNYTFKEILNVSKTSFAAIESLKMKKWING